MNPALILSEDIFVARLPLFVALDVPVLFDIGVIEEGKDANIVFAASVNVVILECVVDDLVALAVDVVHGRVRFVKLGVHIYSFSVAFRGIVIKQAGSSELVPGLCGEVSSVIEEFVVERRMFFCSRSKAFALSHARIAHQDTLQFKIIPVNDSGIVVFLQNCFCDVGNVDSCVAMPCEVQIVLFVTGETGQEHTQSYDGVLSKLLVCDDLILGTFRIAHPSWQLQVKKIGSVIPGLTVDYDVLCLGEESEWTVLVKAGQ